MRDSTWRALSALQYIFKNAHVGGSVTSHQDGTFLYTRPQQTVVGLWLALHDANEGNGCLWARPGSHLEPLRRKFVRSRAESGDGDEVVMKFVNASSADEEVYLSRALLGAAEGNGAADGTAADGGTPPRASASSAGGPALVRHLARLWADGTARLRRALADSKRKRSIAARARRISRSELARSWEGHWPPVNTTADKAAAKELRAQGFVPLRVGAGDLVVIAGTLDHLSLPNLSPRDRHTFQLHMVEGPDAGVEWAAENWLQVPDGATFARL